MTSSPHHSSLLAPLRTLWRSAPIYNLRGALFTLVERIDGYRHERATFKRMVGYELDLAHPRSLNEKIVWKKLFDRDLRLARTADKYRVRDYVRETLGEEGERILVPLLYAGSDPAQIPFDTLPSEYIIKANNDSGGHHIVRAGDAVDRAAVVRRFRRLSHLVYGVMKHEWVYSQIPFMVIVEALLRGEDGDLAQDYKFHVFNGTCRFIHTTPKIDGKRSGKRSLFTPDWQLLPVAWKHDRGPMVPPPAALAEMIRIAEKLGRGFDYVRVDLYNVGGRIYFGELTHYHGSGMERFVPESFDFEAGAWWDWQPDYWKQR
ncbi:MAG TPA: ATP-grasp fold amidoligase family protein [Candidatus Paceibacterota bacterium]|nr:ATP-grasp fold amidoligase family protein [Candidatus Paceibacterota bacterium]